MKDVWIWLQTGYSNLPSEVDMFVETESGVERMIAPEDEYTFSGHVTVGDIEPGDYVIPITMYAHWEGRDAIISTCPIKLIITGGPTIEKELLNGDSIVPRTPKDLETTFELLDKPILHYIDGEEEVYAIIDDGISYEYRKPLPKEEKKDN